MTTYQWMLAPRDDMSPQELLSSEQILKDGLDELCFLLWSLTADPVSNQHPLTCGVMGPPDVIARSVALINSELERRLQAGEITQEQLEEAKTAGVDRKLKETFEVFWEKAQAGVRPAHDSNLMFE